MDRSEVELSCGLTTIEGKDLKWSDYVGDIVSNTYQNLTA